MKISTVERVIIEHNGDRLEMSKEAANRFFQLEQLRAFKRHEQNTASQQTLEARELLDPILPVVE